MSVGLSIAVKLLLAVSVVISLFIACGENRVEDPDLTKASVISRYIENDQVGQAALPIIWFDTTSRADQYGKRLVKPVSKEQVPINPLDYWVESSRTARLIELRTSDTCQIDDVSGEETCNEIRLSNGVRADAEIALMHDTVTCRYFIVDRSDSTIYTKDVEYRETQTALIARLDAGSPTYDGWRLYAVGRQRYGTGIQANRFPAIDSVVVQSLDRAEERFVAYPDRAIQYDWTGDMLQLQRGELLEVSVYSRSRFGNPPIRDAYVHHEVAGEFTHEWMGGDISSDPDTELHSWQIRESSGGQSNQFSQIAVELFQGDALRDSSPNVFAVLLWAIPYQLE